MKDRSEELGRALFAAGAQERAPSALRDSLLQQVQHLPMAASTSAAPMPSPRTRWWWAPLAAAVLPLVWLGSSILGTEPPAPQVSRERVVARPVPQPLAVPAQQATVPVLEAKAPPAEPAVSRDEAPSLPPSPPAVRTPRVQRSKSAPAAESMARAEPVPQVAEGASATPAPHTSVAEQLEALGRIRQALRAGAATRALQLLSREESALASGEFAAEARLLRIEALAGAQRNAEARELAREFVRQFPHDPLVDRARLFLTAPSGSR